MDPKTGINEQTVTIPVGMDCRDIEQQLDIAPDRRHEKGCIRRYGAIPDPWIDHKDCPCHKGSK